MARHSLFGNKKVAPQSVELTSIDLYDPAILGLNGALNQFFSELTTTEAEKLAELQKEEQQRQAQKTQILGEIEQLKSEIAEIKKTITIDPDYKAAAQSAAQAQEEHASKKRAVEEYKQKALAALDERIAVAQAALVQVRNDALQKKAELQRQQKSPELIGYIKSQIMAVVDSYTEQRSFEALSEALQKFSAEGDIGELKKAANNSKNMPEIYKRHALEKTSVEDQVLWGQFLGQAKEEEKTDSDLSSSAKKQEEKIKESYKEGKKKLKEVYIDQVFVPFIRLKKDKFNSSAEKIKHAKHYYQVVIQEYFSAKMQQQGVVEEERNDLIAQAVQEIALVLFDNGKKEKLEDLLNRYTAQGKLGRNQASQVMELINILLANYSDVNVMNKALNDFINKLPKNNQTSLSSMLSNNSTAHYASYQARLKRVDENLKDAEFDLKAQRNREQRDAKREGTDHAGMDVELRRLFSEALSGEEKALAKLQEKLNIWIEVGLITQKEGQKLLDLVEVFNNQAKINASQADHIADLEALFNKDDLTVSSLLADLEKFNYWTWKGATEDSLQVLVKNRMNGLRIDPALRVVGSADYADKQIADQEKALKQLEEERAELARIFASGRPVESNKQYSIEQSAAIVDWNAKVQEQEVAKQKLQSAEQSLDMQVKKQGEGAKKVKQKEDIIKLNKEKLVKFDAASAQNSKDKNAVSKKRETEETRIAKLFIYQVMYARTQYKDRLKDKSIWRDPKGVLMHLGGIKASHKICRKLMKLLELNARHHNPQPISFKQVLEIIQPLLMNSRLRNNSFATHVLKQLFNEGHPRGLMTFDKQPSGLLETLQDYLKTEACADAETQFAPIRGLQGTKIPAVRLADAGVKFSGKGHVHDLLATPPSSYKDNNHRKKICVTAVGCLDRLAALFSAPSETAQLVVKKKVSR